jgi:hypothetical protein
LSIFLLEKMAHTVPAVYAILPAQIRALRSKDQGRQNIYATQGRIPFIFDEYYNTAIPL